MGRLGHLGWEWVGRGQGWAGAGWTGRRGVRAGRAGAWDGLVIPPPIKAPRKYSHLVASWTDPTGRADSKLPSLHFVCMPGRHNWRLVQLAHDGKWAEVYAQLDRDEAGVDDYFKVRLQTLHNEPQRIGRGSPCALPRCGILAPYTPA